MGLSVVLVVASFMALLLAGSIAIPPAEVFKVLFGGEGSLPYVETVVLESRLPMAIGAACCGATLSVAGLMMQTLFHNPLAGPTVLGISSGASLGVAVFMLGGAGMMLEPEWQPLVSTVAAMAGGLVAIMVLFSFSSVLKSGVSLLIVGLMLSYLCSSAISLLNYFSPADEIRSYLVWGLGSFTGLRLNTAVILLILSAVILLPAQLFAKPLNAMLAGERYVESVGYSVKHLRGWLLFSTGLLVAAPTAFCGPIGFIGLIVPHICRLLFRTSNHRLLLPACIVVGAFVSLLCALIAVVPSAGFGVLPVNVITPVIGVPVILYLLVNRNRLPYFS